MTLTCQPIPAVAQKTRTKWVLPSLVILILAALCFTIHLGTGPLAGTEGHRAITAHQMLRDGNYLIPKLYGSVYLAKPPLPYWLIAAMDRLFGPNEFDWRLPSALASALLAAAICAMAARWFDASAGIAAGLAFIAIVPLWSQNRSADVDALNHLGCVIAALALVELGLPYLGKNSFRLGIVATLGVAVSLLSKGPAGLPIILGAVVGPAIANRTWRPFKSTAIYTALVLGALPLLIWGALVKSHTAAPFSGASEAESLLLITTASHLLLVLVLPIVVLAYGIPVGLLIFPPMSKKFLRVFNDQQQHILKALLGTILAAFVIQICSGMFNPRYAYLDLPILTPIAGALVFGWRHQLWPQRGRRDALFWSGVVTILYGAVAIIFLLIGRHRGLSLAGPALIAFISGLALLIAIGIASRFAGHLRLSSAMAALLILLASISFGFYKSAEESERSARHASAPLAAIVPQDARLFSWNAMWSQPELFFYAHLHPTIIRLTPPVNPPSDSWLALDDDEWAAWQKDPAAKAKLSQVHVLHPYKHLVYVCWYSK